MSLKLKKLLRKAVHKTKGFSFALLWIDIRFGVEEWVLLKTAAWRFKHSKRLKLSSMAYHSDKMGWDDVDVSDQWGYWLPCGFGLVAKSNWDFDQQINRDIGEPEQEWKDFVDGDWPTYYYKDEFLNAQYYIHAARKHFRYKFGDQAYDKEIELTLFVQSQKSLDDDMKQYLDWIASGSPKFKVEFSDQAKEDMRRILGEEEANRLFKENDESNQGSDDQK
jgi:hypothetical protein